MEVMLYLKWVREILFLGKLVVVRIVIDTNTWSYHDLPNYLTTQSFINNEQVAGFPANFPYNSCGCNDPANGTTDQFKIKAELTSACLSNSVTIATWKTVNDPLQAEFTAEDVCVGDSTLFINNSTSGCDGNTFDSNEDNTQDITGTLEIAPLLKKLYPLLIVEMNIQTYLICILTLEFIQFNWLQSLIVELTLFLILLQ